MLLITQEQIESFKKFVDSKERFIIIGHKEPDGDCVSSSLGISYILKHLDKPFILVNAGPFKRPELRPFASKFTNEIPFMTKADLDETGLIIVDCSELHRLGELDFDFKELDSFIIDHHKTADCSGKNAIIDSTAPAASSIVQQLYEAIVGKPSADDAHTLFFGMATDTGFFRFLDKSSSEVFKSASRLVDCGVNPREIYQEMSGGKGWLTRKLLGLMLTRAEQYCNGKLVVTYETMEDTRKYGSEGRDSDAFYSLMLAVDGVEAVLFVRQETDHSCTLGFRSVDKCDVSAVASKFGGGGHKNASGASTEGRYETLIPAIVKEFSKVL